MSRSASLAFMFLLTVPPLFAQESQPTEKDESESDSKNPVADLRAKKDENKRYFQIGPAKDATAPKDGFRLLIVLPGSTGTAEFMPFVRRIRAYVLDESYIVAELVSTKWKTEQNTWPTKLAPVPKMEFTTEEFVADVVADIGKRHRLDKKYTFALGWSSSGHVIYNLSLAEKPLINGAYVAMAVFRPNQILPLKTAKDRAWFIDHSPEDEMCPFKDAEAARDALKKAGGKVELVTFAGGHGWFDDPYARMRKGIKFLEESAVAKK